MDVTEQWSCYEGEEDVADSCWWQEFGDPLLDELVSMVLGQNLSLQQAAVRVQEAKAELAIAWGFLFPQQQEMLGYHIKQRISENVPPISILPDNLKSLASTAADRYALNLEAIWEMDIWGAFRKAIDASAAELCASVFDQHALVVSLLGEVASSYIAVRAHQEQLLVLEQNLAVQERSLQIATVRQRNGVVTELDVQNARTQLENTRSDWYRTANGLERARNALGILLSVPPACLPEALCEQGELPDLPDRLTVGIPCDLLRRRPDIRAIEMRAYAQSEKVGIAKAAMLPHFFLFGTFGFESSIRSKVFQAGSRVWKYGPGFRWDFFHYGRLVNAMRVEDALLQELLLQFQEAVIVAQVEVEDGISDYVYAKQREDSLAKGVAAATRAVEIVQLQYREGVVDFTRVLQSQEAQLLMQRRLVKARADAALGVVTVYQAMGGGWQACEAVDYLAPEVAMEMSGRTNWGSLLNDQVQSCGWEERGL